MPSSSLIDLRFPIGGLHRRAGYQQQPPFTTNDALNVWPSDVMKERLRGGSRPGLAKAFNEQLGGGVSVRLLAELDVVKNDGFNYWLDEFDGHELAAAWSFATWLGQAPGVLRRSASVSAYAPEAGLVRSDFGSTFDTANPYVVEILVAPYNGEHHGHYMLYLRMDNATPNVELNGAVVDFNITGSTGAYSGTLTVYVAGVPTVYTLSSGSDGTAQSRWLRALVNGNTVTVTWGSTQLISQAISAPTGRRMGFGMNCTSAGGVCLVDSFRTQYYLTPVNERTRRMLIASAGGTLYRETYLGTMEAVSSSITLQSDRLLNAAQRGQKLYIADHGDPRVTGTDGVRGTGNDRFDAASVSDWTTKSINTNDDVLVIYNATGDLVDGTYVISSVASGELTLASNCASGASGTCSFRIERGPKLYDPASNTLTRWTATSGLGQVPTSCPCVCVYRDRLVLAGGLYNPHIWYMSRQGDPLDWDYGAAEDDVSCAVAGTNADAGQVGEPIIATIPHSDDFLVFGCRTSMWVLRGDPAAGGQIDQIGRGVGIVGRSAWCLGPNSELVFLSRDGLYGIAPGASSFPQSISREKLPQELRDIDYEMHTTNLVYDQKHRGVHIYVSGFLLRNRYHWFFDWETKSFWPMQMYDSHEPFAAIAYNATDSASAGVVLGCYDGYLRRFRETNDDDDGQAFTSYITYGPIKLAPDYRDGLLKELIAIMAAGSGSVTWSLYVGDGSEIASENATAFATGTWATAGSLNLKARPRARGASFVLKLQGGGEAWSVERLSAVRDQVGVQRP